MEAILFILVIVILILVHEFGHFVVAKLSGMRVDEFGIGYPPRALTLGKAGETTYTLNWLPFGGFVKIYGEDGEGAGTRAFGARPRILQALVLVAGVAMNLLFAYVLITGVLMVGAPRALSPEEIPQAHDVQLAVAGVLPGSPADKAGLAAGDTILSAQTGRGTFSSTDPLDFTNFIASSSTTTPITLSLKTVDGKSEILSVRPATNISPVDPARPALGVEVATVGIVPLSFGKALVQGGVLTWSVLSLTASGLWHFLYGALTLHANLSQVAGPIGIAGAVGSASAAGFTDLLWIVAVISINLALINAIPIPALDGGRLLFVLIEGVIRRPIKMEVARTVNAVSFALLILLMVVVTLHDIYRIIT